MTSEARLTFPCAGLDGCDVRVLRRGEMCDRCRVELPRRRRALAIADARASVSPDGALDYCVPGNDLYVQRTSKVRAAAYAMGDMDRRPKAIAIIERATWTRDTNGVLLLGPTGIGKSKVLTGIALRILRKAENDDGLDVASFRFASGLRYVNAIQMARAARARKLGEVDRAFELAEHASLLLIDETGYEEERGDPTLVRDLLRARYEPRYRPTIMASGQRFEALNERYGEAAVRTVWECGLLIDLHAARTEVRR